MTHQPKSYKKFVATAATATLVATAIVPAASAATPVFTDVSKDYKEAVNYIVEKGFAAGTSDTTFGTAQNISRGDAAVMIANALGLDTANAPDAGFQDVNNRVAGAVNAIVDAKIASGRTSSKFDPAAYITRQEMAKMLANAYKLEAKTNSGFTDVNKNWIEFAAALKDAGITLGKTETTFAPEQNLTRGEFALFMFRAETMEPAALTVKTATATSATKLSVTLSDDTVHEVTLEKALVANVATEVTFAIDGKEYSATVTYVTSAPEVVSVTAINAKQVEVNFSTPVEKNSVIQAGSATGQLVADTFKLEHVASTTPAVDLNNATGVLSADGKTLTITYVGSEFANGDYVFSVAKNKVQTTNKAKTEYIPAYTSSTLAIKDATHPTVVTTEKVNATQYRLTFNEPIKSQGVISAVYADGSGPATVTVAAPTTAGQKTLTVTLDASVTVGKALNVTLVGVSDYNNNLVTPNPITFSAVKGDKDGVAPTAAVTAVSATKLEVKFSELVQNFPAKADFTIDTNALAAGDTIVQDTLDKTKYTINLATPLTAGFHNIAVAANKFADLSGEGNAAHASTIQITADQVAPLLETSKVVKERDGKEYLVLTFNKDVKLGSAILGNAMGGTFDTAAKSVKDYITTSPVTISTDATFVANGTGIRNEYKIPLANVKVGGAALVKGTTYTFALPTAAVETLTGTTSVAKPAAITITRGTDTAVTGLAVSDVVTNQSGLVASADSALANNKVKVTFDQAVDGASATTASNYVIDGAVVKTAELASDNVTVTLTLEDDKSTYSGARYLTIAGVKTSAGLALEETFKKAITLNENISPTVTGVKINAVTPGTPGTAEVELTFSEAVSHAANTTDFDVFVNGVIDGGVTVATTTATGATASNKVLVTITLDDVAKLSSKTITLKAGASIDFKDAAGNTVKVGTVIVK